MARKGSGWALSTIVGGGVLLLVGWFIFNQLSGHHSPPPTWSGAIR